MARKYETGLLITGDSKGAVRAASLTQDEIAKLNDTTKKFNRTTADSGTALQNYAGKAQVAAKAIAAFGVAAGAAAGAALVTLIKNGLEAGDALAKTSDKLGIATEELQSLRRAANLTGVESNTLDMALQRMTRRIAEAAAGTGEAVPALNALGLSAQELVRLSPDEAFARIADEMNKVSNQSQKVQLAFKLFDSEGVSLVNTLRLGSAGLADVSEQMRTLGVLLDRESAGKIEQTNDALSTLSLLWDGLGNQLAAQVAPVLTGIVNSVVEWINQMGGMGVVASRVFAAMVDGAALVANSIDIVVRISKASVAGLKGLWVALQRGIEVAAKALDSENGRKVRAGLLILAGQVPLAITTLGGTPDPNSFDRRIAKLDKELATLAKTADDLLRPLFDPNVGLLGDKLRAQVAEFQFESEAAWEASRGAALEYEKQVISTDDVIKSLQKSTKEVADGWTDVGDIIGKLLGRFGEMGNHVAGIVRQIASLSSSNGGITGGIGAFLQQSGGIGGVLGTLGLSQLGTGSGFSAGLGTLGGQAAEALVLGASGFGGSSFASNFGTTFDLNQIGLSAGASFIGGKAGTALSQALTGKVAESNIGQTIGSALGAFIGGPIGAGVGSAIGSFVDTLFGGDGKVRVTVGVGAGATPRFHEIESAIASSGLRLGALNRRGGADGEAAALGLLDTFLQIDAALNAAAGGNINLSGRDLFAPQIAGQPTSIGHNVFGSVAFNEVSPEAIQGAADDFVKSWLKAVNSQLPRRVGILLQGVDGTAQEIANALAAAMSIDRLLALDVVGDTARAADELGQSQHTLLEAYGRQNEHVLELVSGFDGSTEAIIGLNEALAGQKTIATQLAIAYEALEAQISVTFGSAISFIEESLLNDEELYGLRRSQIADLTEQLANTIDPQQIDALITQIDALSREAFGLLDEGQQASLANEFVSFLTEAQAVALDQVASGQAGLASRETGLAESIDFDLFNGAVTEWRDAVDEFRDAVQQMADSFGGFTEGGVVVADVTDAELIPEGF